MNGLEMVERLAEAARRESPPAVDLTAAVMRRLVARRAPTPGAWPLAVAISAVAAAALVLALQVWVTAQDPIVEFMSSVRMVMLK